MAVNVLSEPTRPSLGAKGVSWLSANEGAVVVDSIILGHEGTVFGEGDRRIARIAAFLGTGRQLRPVIGRP